MIREIDGRYAELNQAGEASVVGKIHRLQAAMPVDRLGLGKSWPPRD
jgi:hypothetical protein